MIVVETVGEASGEIRDALNALLPQLSSSATPLDDVALERLLGSPAVTLFVARLEGRVVGTLTLVQFPIPTGWRAWIEDVVVDESARGLGVGARLTAAAVEAASAAGARSVDLTSRPSREAANALYQRLGFERRETNVYRFFIERGFPSESS